MKKLIAIITLCVVIPSVTMSATDEGKATDPTKVSRSTISDSEEPSSQIPITSPNENPNGKTSGQQENPGDYEDAMIAISQKFSATLATIAEAAQQGKISRQQAKEMSAEQYQLIHMQFQLLSLWRQIDEDGVARTPDPQENPAPVENGEMVMVALPFSSLQLNPSLSEYLGLTPSQVAAIQRAMMLERQSLEPLMIQMRITREKLLAIGIDRMNEKEVKSLAQDEAALLAKLIVANARMRSKIYKVLSPAQQRKLSNLERTQGSSAAKEDR